MLTNQTTTHNAPPVVEYLSDALDRVVYSQQSWGQLGVDTCAYAPGQTPLPLRIKDRTYSKGLGHHAGGEIVVELDGQYDAFEAEIGVQWQNGNVGSVVFQVFVDDRKRFDSGVMREQDAPRRVRIPLKGAQELRLVATDAGDGITCDCANWAEARLIRTASPTPPPPLPLLDIAPCARVITGDPARMDGARANRIQEYRAEDLFLETDLLPDGMETERAQVSICYRAPVKDGRACIGLHWEERRTFRELSVQFAGPAPSVEGAQVQAWFGESPFQGVWKPLHGAITAQGDRWVLKVERKENPELRTGTWKVRWVLPTAQPLLVRRLMALAGARLQPVEVRLQLERPLPGQRAEIEIYNGLLTDTPEREGAERSVPTSVSWDLGAPLTLSIRALKPRAGQMERTVLRFRLPTGAFGVAVDDLLAHRAVYVQEAGLLVSLASTKMSLEDYRRRIARSKTVLERVRRMPDQTFEQALAKTHRLAQDAGPMLLSLACDNRKFVVEREGAIRFEAAPENADRTVNEPLKNAGVLEPRFGSGSGVSITRRLDGGWLPAHVTLAQEGGLLYRERAFVVPFDKPSTGWLNRRPLCVVEFTVENPQLHPARASLALTFLANANARRPADLRLREARALVLDGERLQAVADFAEAGSLRPEAREGMLALQGEIPANGRARCVVYIPAWPMAPEEIVTLRGGAALWADFEAYWQQVMAPAMEIEIPDPLLQNIIRASQVHCLIAARNEAEGARIAPWIASMHYGPLESESNSIIRGMDMLGHHEFARRSLDFYVARYSPEGFLTTGYTLMGTGWHLWTLGEHIALTRDTEWLKRVAPEVARVCAWIVRQRKKTKRLDARGERVPIYGLIPPGVMADWNAFAFYFCLNGYYYAGLHHAARALADIGYPDADALLADAAEFRQDILRAYHRTQALAPVFPLQNGVWIPEYPSQVHCPGPTNLYFPGEDGNRSWAYDVELGAHQLVPQGVLEPDAPETAQMMDHLEDVHFLSDGWFDYPGAESRRDWFNLGGFSKVQPYYTRNAEIYALRDDVRPFLRSYFNTLAAMLNTENLSLWEHFHHSGAWNKTHETGYFLQQTRFLFVMERGAELWLAPFVTSNWLKDGQTVAVRRAPTRFGPVSYRIISHVKEGWIEARIEPPARSRPHALVLRLRHPEGKRLRAVTVNGVPHKDFDPAKEYVRIRSNGEAIVVRAEYR